MPPHVPNTAFAVAQDIRDLAGYLEYLAGCYLRGAVEADANHDRLRAARARLVRVFSALEVLPEKSDLAQLLLEAREVVH